MIACLTTCSFRRAICTVDVGESGLKIVESDQQPRVEDKRLV